MNPFAAALLAVASLAACAGTDGAKPAPSASAVPAAVPAAPPSPDAGLAGRWKGTWYGGGISNDFDLDVRSVTAEAVAGRMRFTTSGGCSGQWQDFVGRRREDGRVAASVNLGGPCGRVDVDFAVQGGEAGPMVRGNYVSQYPDNGFLRAYREP